MFIIEGLSVCTALTGLSMYAQWKKSSVYCEVRPESVSTIAGNLTPLVTCWYRNDSFFGRHVYKEKLFTVKTAMAPASHCGGRDSIAGQCSCEIFGGQSGTGTFFLIIPVFPRRYHSANAPPASEYHLSGQAGETWEPSHKAPPCRISGCTWHSRTTQFNL
jgi:hypothetical protein